jgi:outer membrane receptor protein involved in Fe transport
MSIAWRASGLCVTVLAAVAAALPASAAEEELEEIVVTAQRRAESVQSVSIAVTALSGDQLADKAVARLDDLQFAAPALTITDAGLSRSVNIRGIGLASGSPAVTAGVATYVDGLFQPPIAPAPVITTSAASRCCAVRRAPSWVPVPPVAPSSSTRAIRTRVAAMGASS